MAQSTNNVVMKGMKGKIGDMLVFRQRFGKTIVTKTPVRTATPTDKQILVQERFLLATRYAQAAIKDVDNGPLYKAAAGSGVSALNVAFADFFTGPVIPEITFSAYNGTVGSKIQVMATDDFMVKSVDVKITKADGTIIEEGAAAADTDGLHWSYTATQANGVISGCKITATAKDLPANVTVKEEIIP